MEFYRIVENQIHSYKIILEKIIKTQSSATFFYPGFTFVICFGHQL